MMDLSCVFCFCCLLCICPVLQVAHSCKEHILGLDVIFYYFMDFHYCFCYLLPGSPGCSTSTLHCQWQMCTSSGLDHQATHPQSFCLTHNLAVLSITVHLQLPGSPGCSTTTLLYFQFDSLIRLINQHQVLTTNFYLLIRNMHKTTNTEICKKNISGQIIESSD